MKPIKVIEKMFVDIEEKLMTAHEAISLLVGIYSESYIYIPKKHKSKREIIRIAYDNDYNAKQIAHNFNISINYVYRVINELNGENLCKHLTKTGKYGIIH